MKKSVICYAITIDLLAMKNEMNFFRNNENIATIEQYSIKNEIRSSNLIRCTIIMAISIFVSSVIIFFYSRQIQNDAGTVLLWKTNVIFLNKCVGSIFILQACTAIFLFKSNRTQTALTSSIIVSTFIIIPLWGAIGTILDQLVATSLISFLVVCVITSVGLLMTPLISFFSFGGIYLVFYYGIGLTQKNAEALFLNRIDGFCIVATSFGLSYFFWRNNLVKIRQKKIIINQKHELESNYQKLLYSSEELKKAITTKDKFFSILGHDLRGPLTTSHSLTKLVSEGVFENTPAEKANAINMIDKSLENVIKLLNDLLLWSLTQTNNISYKPSLLHLNEVVNSNIELMEISAEKKGIEIINNLEKDISVTADKNMLDTMLRNLISNSIKFSSRGNKVKIYAETASTKNENYTIITVADQGMGISPKVQELLFNIEHKTSTPGTHKETGTGLGLILCKELAEQHNGYISLESKEGEGSKFMIHLPTANNSLQLPAPTLLNIKRA